MSDKKLIKVNTEEFLHSLHYALGSFNLNLGDGETWMFDIREYERVRCDVIAIFRSELDALLEKACKEYTKVH